MTARPTAALLLSLATTAAADELSCRVVEVVSGDSLVCLTVEPRREQIRLRAITAPQAGQPFAEPARQRLAELVQKRPVTVYWDRRDEHGWIHGSVWVTPPDCPACGHTLDAGAVLLNAGLARWQGDPTLEQPVQERERYRFEADEARLRQRGLWRRSAVPAPGERHVPGPGK